MLISSQNHGFAVDETTLPDDVARDASLAVRRLPAGRGAHRPPGVQLPGSSRGEPGPHDLRLLFEHFMYLMVKRMQANSRGRNPVKQKSAEG